MNPAPGCPKTSRPKPKRPGHPTKEQKARWSAHVVQHSEQTPKVPEAAQWSRTFSRTPAVSKEAGTEEKGWETLGTQTAETLKAARSLPRGGLREEGTTRWGLKVGEEATHTWAVLVALFTKSKVTTRSEKRWKMIPDPLFC